MWRYQVIAASGTKGYVIWDRELGGWCALPDDASSPHPNLLPLEWANRQAAEAWLFRCREKWSAGLAPAPRGFWPVGVPYDQPT